jgi:DNA-binding response OmpR family regulator
VTPSQARVLMVEDEMCLAFLLEDLLAHAGFQVKCAARVEDALRLAHATHFDVAVLDINLGGDSVFRLAGHLRDDGTAIVFSTGYGRDGLPPDYADCPVLQKPYPPDQLPLLVEDLVRDRPVH